MDTAAATPGVAGPSRSLRARNLQGPSGVGRPSPGGPWIRIRRMQWVVPARCPKIRFVQLRLVDSQAVCLPALIYRGRARDFTPSISIDLRLHRRVMLSSSAEREDVHQFTVWRWLLRNMRSWSLNMQWLGANDLVISHFPIYGTSRNHQRLYLDWLE